MSVAIHQRSRANNQWFLLLAGIVIVTSISFNIKQIFDIQTLQSVNDSFREVIDQPITQTIIYPPQIIVEYIEVEAKKPVREVNSKELQCLAENIYYEAENQSLAGKIAVGQVTLNRVNNSGYPSTVCGVVNQRINGVCMFSWKCQPYRPIRSQREWKQSKQIAHDLLSKPQEERVDITDGATHFHSTRIRPNWKLRQITKIDDHIFYK